LFLPNQAPSKLRDLLGAGGTMQLNFQVDARTGDGSRSVAQKSCLAGGLREWSQPGSNR
jgi:hypothetical protein